MEEYETKEMSNELKNIKNNLTNNKKTKVMDIGEIFLSFLPLLKFYMGYFTNYQELEQDLNNERKKNKDLQTFLKNIKSKEIVKGNDINNLLIKPIQR
jgi:hypothetical protein